MSEPFDPYYIWLGIPPEDQPPNHYRLLGITLFEANREVIEAAANRQMNYLQEISSGEEHINEAQRLLGEVSRARICLLNEEKKAEYDAELRSEPPTSGTDSLAEEAGLELQVEPPGPAPFIDVPPEPPAFPGLTSDTKSPAAPLPDGLGASQPAPTRPRKKKQNLVPMIGLVVAVLVLFGGGLTLYFSSQAQQRQKDRKESIAKKHEQLDRDAKKEEADRIAAERKAKKEAQRKAKEEADRKAKEEAERKAKEETERKAKEETERKAKEETERKAKEEAERIAANPEEALESQGLEKKGNKWVLAVEKPLQATSKALQTDWKQWANAVRAAQPSQVKSVLVRYGELFQKTREYQAMRLALAQEYERAATDPLILDALETLGQKPKLLLAASKQFGRPDAIMKKFEKVQPVIGNFACLIINEKVPVVIQVDEQLLGERDGPHLFFLPRTIQAKVGLPISGHGQKWMSNNYRAAMLETTVPSLRFGPARAQNIRANFHPTSAEGGAGNGEATYGGKVGKAAWEAFVGQLKQAPASAPTAQEIAAARKELERLLTESSHE